MWLESIDLKIYCSGRLITNLIDIFFFLNFRTFNLLHVRKCVGQFNMQPICHRYTLCSRWVSTGIFIRILNFLTQPKPMYSDLDYCQTLHIMDSTGSSVIVNKKCANRTECHPSTVGCLSIDKQTVRNITISL